MIVGKRNMPRSKHHTKKTSDSSRRKANNIRKSVRQYLEGKTHKMLKAIRVPDKDIDRRFSKAFPDRILKKARMSADE